jgi:hypothetical protein
MKIRMADLPPRKTDFSSGYRFFAIFGSLMNSSSTTMGSLGFLQRIPVSFGSELGGMLEESPGMLASAASAYI